MPVNMRDSTSVPVELVPRLLGNQPLAAFEKLLGMDLIVHVRAVALVEMFEMPIRKSGARRRI
jgi:hypothetical protein